MHLNNSIIFSIYLCTSYTCFINNGKTKMKRSYHPFYFRFEAKPYNNFIIIIIKILSTSYELVSFDYKTGPLAHLNALTLSPFQIINYFYCSSIRIKLKK